MHVRRVTRDVYANRSTHAVGVPRRHLPVLIAMVNKTIVTRHMTKILTTAKTWYVIQNLRIISCKLIYRSKDFRWASCRKPY